MRSLLIGPAALAIMAATPASAQLLGGGLGGGLGGNVGGVGGTLGGGLNGSLGTMPAVTSAAAQARAEARQAERAARREAARQRKLGIQSDVTTSAAFAPQESVASRPVAVGGEANATTTSRSALDTYGIRSRGITSATERGLRRVASTGRGVPVFVAAQTPVPTAVVAHSVSAYPIYDHSVYAGGGDTTFISYGEVGGYVDRQYDDLRRDMRGTGASVTRRGNDLVLELPADVTFAFDKADIQPRFLGTLSAVARSLGDYRATDVEIVGHTDSIGSDAYNLALSERRGRSVADYLVDHSADPSRLVVEAMGKSEPIASNATIAGRAANRRVEIVFHPRVVRP